MATRPPQHDVPSTIGGDGQAPAVPERPPAPEPSHAERCRTLVASTNRGALSTLTATPEGFPYGSVASYAINDDGDPLFFVSLMAEHTQNAMRDARASLLVADVVAEGSDPLASGRVTLLGSLSSVSDADRAGVRDRYLTANPTAAYYIDFGDFAFYRLGVSAIRYVGGYGRMSWVDPKNYARAEPDPLAGSAAEIIEHMNADHGPAQALMCRNLAGYPDVTTASMSAVDRYGFDMVAVGPAGRSTVRLGFAEPCRTPDAVRQAMIALVTEARSA